MNRQDSETNSSPREGEHENGDVDEVRSGGVDFGRSPPCRV
jgi:hypothetical protein